MKLKPIITGLILTFSSSSLYADEVHLFTWEEYIAEEVIAAFTAKTGHTIKQTYLEDEGERDAAMASGRAQAFDLVMMETLGVSVMAKQGLLHEMSESRGDIAQYTGTEWMNNCGEFGVPYSWGTQGLLYRESVAVEPIDSWMQLFEVPAEHQGKVAMYMDTIDATAMALMAGYNDPFSENITELKQAFALLKRQQQYLLTTEYGYVYSLENKEGSQLSMMSGFSDDLEAVTNATGQDDWAFIIPKEGTTIWTECWVAPADKTITPATREWLAFINQPEIAALNAETIWFSTTNTAALEFASEEYLNDPTLFPPEEVFARSTPYRLMNVETLSIRSRMIDALQ